MVRAGQGGQGAQGGQGGPSFWRRLFSVKGILGLIAGVILLGIVTFGIAYLLIPIPDPNERAQAQTSIIYYADGKTEMARFAEVNRESVPLSQVPKHVQHAMLAAEDRSFYENPGFSPTGIARAVWSAVSGGERQGGSTITQQYVKNYFLTQDQTMGRKLRELIISVKIEQQLSKDQILQDYLNTIYYGRGADGIQAASRAYFNLDVSKLDVAQGALLASVIRAPSLYDPALGASQKKNAQERVKYVLDGMVEQGWLSSAQRRTVKFPAVVEPKSRTSASGPNGYLVEMVKSELATKIGLSDADIDRGGLRITTTVLRKNQTAAIEAVEQQRPSGGKADDIRVGLASIKPGDGAILALYGGKNFATEPYNAATQAQLQGGSTFKVFTLVAALEKGISTKTSFDGASPQYFPEFRGGGNASGRVTNFGGASYGWMSLRDALSKSVNTIFAKVNIDVGPKATVDAAVKLGLPPTTLGLSDNYANVFGTASPHVIDMANAYATLAAGGKKAEPYLVKSVESVDGSPAAWNVSPNVTQAVSPEVAADAVEAMTRVVERGSATRAQALGRPAAGKTGTTTENRAVWFDGFTPQAATAVGMYLPDKDGNPQPLQGIGGRSELTGGSYPVSIWTAFMRDLLDGQERLDFPDRAGIGDGDVPQQAPAPTAPEPTVSQTPEPTTSTPATQSPTWTPTDVAPTPTGEPTGEPEPTRTREPQPTQEPTQDESDGAGQQGHGQQGDRQGSGQQGTDQQGTGQQANGPGAAVARPEPKASVRPPAPAGAGAGTP